MPGKRYQVIATKAFVKDLNKIDPKAAKWILEKKNQLAVNPYIGKKLANMIIGQWSIRVGKDYRIRYDIENDAVYLYRVRHRKDIYKKK